MKEESEQVDTVAALGDSSWRRAVHVSRASAKAGNAHKCGLGGWECSGASARQ